MLVIVTKYKSRQLDELRKLARNLKNRLYSKSTKLEIICSYEPLTESFHIIARLFLFGELSRTSIAIDGCERISFLKALKDVLNLN
ncbi:hypothetical protein GCM10025767_23610 [Thalassotalea piscium]|uniref:Uncharacterized protein n=1 Tax=Thalassotalea piscium TaxID=1230533 RepID=A0A7X0NE03_9GAMM|nr:hypothetical protein [Thalassotalea piscium]